MIFFLRSLLLLSVALLFVAGLDAMSASKEINQFKITDYFVNAQEMGELQWLSVELYMQMPSCKPIPSPNCFHIYVNEPRKSNHAFASLMPLKIRIITSSAIAGSKSSCDLLRLLRDPDNGCHNHDQTPRLQRTPDQLPYVETQDLSDEPNASSYMSLKEA